MIFTAERIGDGENEAAGRWRLNSGSEMILTVPALNKKPIRAVIDIASAKMKNGQDRIVALYGHDDEKVIGFWDKGVFAQNIEADLHLIKPKDEMEANVLRESVAVAAMARSGVPIQVSVGAEPGTSGKWKYIPPGEKISCNGREYCGDGELPLYVLESGEVYEASIVTFGADSVTGRIAARLHLPVFKEEAPMSDKLKALLGKFAQKHHGLVARCVAESEDEAVITSKVHAAELAEKDAEIAALKAENEALKAKKTEEVKATDDKVKAAAKAADRGVTFSEKTEEKTDEPKTLTAAMTAMQAAGAKERGFALRAAALAKYPNVQRI